MIAEILLTIYLLCAFIWALKDITNKTDTMGLHWWVVFLFLFMFFCMPILAVIEKTTNELDWFNVIKKIFKLN